MMFPLFVRSLLVFSALSLSAAPALCAEAPGASASRDELIRSSCVMVKAHIVPGGGGGAPMASATGTGFFVASDLILTCNHCTRIPMRRGIVNANDVQVELDGGRFVSARVIARDPAHDLALLQIDAQTASELGCKPLSLSRFSLSSGSPITIIGNFPEAIRLTRGELVARSVMKGFAMGSAKVRSGFSGGPVMSEDGTVQGILSQRDDDNNSIFVRSDVILSMLSRYGRPTAPREKMPEPASRQTLASAKKEAVGDDGAKFQPVSKNSPETKSAGAPSSGETSLVVALPVRPVGE